MNLENWWYNYKHSQIINRFRTFRMPSWLLLFRNTWKSGSSLLMLFYSLTFSVEANWVWQYSAKSAYNLQGTFLWFCCLLVFEPWELIWRTWAPKKCQFFLWLAAHDRWWTADWLAKKVLPHLSHGPLCDQVKTIQHTQQLSHGPSGLMASF